MALYKNHKGVALIEAVIALGIVGIVLGALAGLFFTGRSFINDTPVSQRAFQAARTDLELTRIIAYEEWDDLDEDTYGIQFNGDSWGLTSSPTVIGDFTHTIVVEDIDEDTKTITAQIDWTTPETGSIELITLVANWEEHESQIPPPGGGQ